MAIIIRYEAEISVTESYIPVEGTEEDEEEDDESDSNPEDPD